VQVIWEEFLKIIKEEAGSQIVETWFKSVHLEDWNKISNQVILKVPNQFVRNWIKDHYLTLIKTHLSRLLNTNKEMTVFFICKNKTNEERRDIMPAERIKNNNTENLKFSTEEENNENPTDTKQEKKTNLPAIIKKNVPNQKALNNINPAYIFDTFVVGPSNSLAHAAAYAICQNLGRVYNPLFIYGGTGLGKTHLLHAIGNELKSKNNNIIVKYETSDCFINEFINSIRFDRTDQFRNKHKKVDLLLLDDIQFLSNKEQTQEMFFHIFNSLYEKGKQIVLSSDTFPNEIEGLQNRLRSRMEWGLVADIQIPDLETKIAILKKKADTQKINLPDNVADLIASSVKSNVRELEGALIRIGAFSSLTNQEICLNMAKKVLFHFNTPEKKKDSILFEKILKKTARFHSISINDIKSKKRQKDIAIARQVTFFLMKKLTLSSLQTIGSFIGNRDHSTVIHAVSKVESYIKNDTSFERKIKSIEQEILHNQ
jgi:chromosomal replication initiator protein